MRVLVINPNSTSAMTVHVADLLHPLLDLGSNILQYTAINGPPVIATEQTFNAAAKAACYALGEAFGNDQHIDHVLLACFGDPGLEAMRLTTTTPITGLAHASMQIAERTNEPYAIVTAGTPWEAILNQRFRRWGASTLFRGVQVINGTGQDVFNDPLAALPAVQHAIAAARATGAKHIILGGAAFAGYKAIMQKSGIDTHGLLDCVACAADAIKQIEH
jgi:Asp/Glu/hydantoin racemase